MAKGLQAIHEGEHFFDALALRRRFRCDFKTSASRFLEGQFHNQGQHHPRQADHNKRSAPIEVFVEPPAREKTNAAANGNAERVDCKCSRAPVRREVVRDQ